MLMRQGQTTRTDYFIEFKKTVTKICRNRFKATPSFSHSRRQPIYLANVLQTDELLVTVKNVIENWIYYYNCSYDYHCIIRIIIITGIALGLVCFQWLHDHVLNFGRETFCR